MAAAAPWTPGFSVLLPPGHSNCMGHGCWGRGRGVLWNRTVHEVLIDTRNSARFVRLFIATSLPRTLDLSVTVSCVCSLYSITVR